MHSWDGRKPREATATPDAYLVIIEDVDGVLEYEVLSAPSPLLAMNTAVRRAVQENEWSGDKPFSIDVIAVHRNNSPDKKWWKP